MAAFRTGSQRPRGEIAFVVIVVALGVIALVAWFLDPRHQDDGGSRMNWPEKKDARP